ncbi:hypothetical protein V7O61_11945 [Methanolobus sp. WCC1]|uniref:Uncharacterized protein n=1 Tax=Methanolobus tindarius DSM 2278 TaxID=1090322 RepID=W9DS70_METTI|nr:hypothetical protein [Methanolobus tindarius]ETA68623.1 hypothetical protein MettiDRAFT_2096 [Methanolobus tindarius DSM 2278]
MEKTFLEKLENPILELTTKIPKEKILYAICEFYRKMGHREILLIKESDDDINYEDYNPLNLIGNTIEITRISVIVSKLCKKENELKFDSIQIKIEDDVLNNKIQWNVDSRIKAIHVITVIFLAIGLVATVIYGYHNIYPENRFLSRYATGLLAGVTLGPVIYFLFYLLYLKVEKIKSHSGTIKYAKDFEEFIRYKEEEWSKL